MTEFDAQEQLAEERRRRYAQQFGNMQAPQGRMVGGTYVAPHFLEYLASGLRGFGAARGEQMAAEELGQLRQQRSEANKKAMADFLRLSQGTPEQVIPNAAPMDDEGNLMPQAVKPAQAPNLGAAYGALMEAPDAGMRQMGLQGQLTLGQQQAEQQRKAAEQQRLFGILQNSTPQQAIAAGVPAELVKQYYESPMYGRQKVIWKDIGTEEIPLTEYGERPANVAPLQKTGNVFSDLLVRDPRTGEIVRNAPLIGAKSEVGLSTRPQISVDARNFNTQESEQSKVYGKGLGEIRSAINQAGFDAPKKMAQLDRMETLLAGIDGGAAAPAIADIASFANSFGVKLDPKLGNKQAAEALTRELAGSLRQPGTGPMTDKDFDNFLKQVPGLAKTAEGRAQIITTMRSALERDIAVSKFAREYARRNNGVIDDNFFDAVADFYAKNPVVTPSMPASNARGQAFSDPQKEKRYQEWLKNQGAR